METECIVARIRSKGLHNLVGPTGVFGAQVMPLTGTLLPPAQPTTGRSCGSISLTGTGFGPSMMLAGSGSGAGLSAADVQFTLAVYVKAYPGPVLSIWVYLAALWRRSIQHVF
ncbi:unnamed protein product [Protopolystoma xenopodis]|uniref:Uncharacterized protein n=1 Tax=Protopolystoma xenopodis TaxID=117903 RepID=A0A448X5M1_9PLAT|nr:unnamed protein product [Protopolystoma xenopodis]